MSAAIEDRPHYIYRHFDADGRLLYVGLTVNPRKRPFARQGRPWVASSHIQVSAPMGKDEALAAERAAIRDEAPVHNIYRNNGNVTAMERANDAWLDSRTDEERIESDRRMAQIISDALARRAS